MTRPARTAALAACAAAAALAGCKDRRDASPGGSAAPPPGAPGASPGVAVDAAVADANLDACRAAAERAASLPPVRRAEALIDGCQPCGDWTPLLAWNTPTSAGGPPRAAIEAALIACKAFCSAASRQRFLNTLDAARGQGVRGPWRHLGEMCKAEVSAVPDSRFMGAPYFALDRIARALGALGDPALLAAIEIPLPALGLSAVGFDLPEAAATSDAGPTALTVDAGQVVLGALPVAKLSATGLSVAGDYPGAPVELGKLAAALATPAFAGRAAAVLAPRALPAARIAQVVAAAKGHEVRIAAGAPGPGGWSVPVAVPVALIARSPGGVRIALGGDASAAVAAARAAAPAELARGAPTIAIDRAATVEGLTSLLSALAVLDVRSAALVASKP